MEPVGLEPTHDGIKLEGLLGLEPRDAGIKIQCDDQLRHSPTLLFPILYLFSIGFFAEITAAFVMAVHTVLTMFCF